MRKTAIWLMRLIGTFIPISVSILAARRKRGLRFLIPPGKRLVYDKYLNTIKVNIDTTYPIELEMLTGSYDLNTSSIIKRFIKEDSVIIDVGANVGALTLLMAKIANAGRVIAIEPGPSICSRLRFNIKLNSELKNTIEVLQIGISDKSGELFWKEDKKNRGNAGLLGGAGEIVKVDTLDHVVNAAGLKKIDFIKIDVEGMEYEVVKGGMNSITQHRPLIYYETLEAFRDSRGFDLYGEIFNLLHSIDYQHFAILQNSNGELSKVNNLDVLCSANVLAIPNEKQVFTESVEMGATST